MTVPLIVVLVGRKGSGKDTVADALVKDHGFTKAAFADALRSFACSMTNMAPDFFTDRRLKDTPLHRWGSEVATEAYQRLPAEWRKLWLTPRDILKKIGQGARGSFGDDFWIERLTTNLTRWQKVNKRFIVSDTRRWNELHAGNNAFGQKFSYGSVFDGDPIPKLVVRLNRADRQHCHDFQEFASGTIDRCAFVLLLAGSAMQCGLPRASHPSHYSGDFDVTETELPDESALYDIRHEGLFEETPRAVQNIMLWVNETEYKYRDPQLSLLKPPTKPVCFCGASSCDICHS